MGEKDNQARQITNELKDIEEKQLQNQRDLKRLEQMEENFLELNRDSQHLFDRLFSSWRQDKDFARQIEQDEAEFQHLRRQSMGELEMRKLEFLEAKRNLFDLEDELHWLKRSLGREEK